MPPTDLLEIAERAVSEFGAMQKPRELAALLGTIRSLDPASVWEIGTATGGTLWAVACVLGPGRTYVSIDLPEGPHAGAYAATPAELKEMIDAVAWPCELEVIHGDSREVDLPESPPPNLLLIDGDHTYAGVRADYERYGPLVPEGGLVGLHDVVAHSDDARAAGVEVDRFWAELLETGSRTAELVDPSGRRPGSGRWGGDWGGWGLVYR